MQWNTNYQQHNIPFLAKLIHRIIKIKCKELPHYELSKNKTKIKLGRGRVYIYLISGELELCPVTVGGCALA